MHFVEKACLAIRHHPHLKQTSWLWNGLRPFYNTVIGVIGHKGLKSVINGTDPILVSPQWRIISEDYELPVWQSLMSRVREGDIVVDVGAFIGLYTVALAKRVGPTGRVIAFEPDPINFAVLKRHVDLNAVNGWVDLFQAAAGTQNGSVHFEFGRSNQSRVAPVNSGNQYSVESITLDQAFMNKRIDLLKIDVEGYEGFVLHGAANLLKDQDRKPRAIYIEAHPYAWPALGTTSERLLNDLISVGYRVTTTNGQPVKEITAWSEVVACYD